MSRKDYELIAEVFAKAIHSNIASLYTLAEAMANRLEADNPRFDRMRFLKACGLED